LPAGRGELVLVAGGERSAAELARATLEAYGYRVLVGDPAAHPEGEVRAVLLDAAAAPPGLTDWWAAHPAAAVLTAGDDLPKPYTAEQLLRALHAALHPPGDSP
jgi:hypothetical protein